MRPESLVFSLAISICFAQIAIDDVSSPSDHLLIRDRRSNIPCGSAFTPCNRRPFIDASQDQPLDGNGLANDGTTATGSSSSPQGAGQFVTAPNIRKQMLQLATNEAKDEVDRLLNQTEQDIIKQGLSDQSEIGRLYSTFTRSYQYARELSYAALVSISASQRLRSFGLKTEEIVYGLPKMDLDGTVLDRICPPNPIEECVPGKFRTYSGFCNNVNNPLWGASFEPLQRFVPPDYSDEVSQPRAASDGSPLPNARTVSAQIFTDQSKPHKSLSLMVMQWAQFVYNDMAQMGTAKALGDKTSALPCCDPKIKHPECYPIEVASTDPAYAGAIGCLPYARTIPAPREHCLLGPREQANFVTSYLDASTIYGSTGERADSLRTKQDGKLKSSRVPFIKDLLPAATFSRDNCRGSESQPCFVAGSDQVNVLPTLTAMHTIWVRQHNRLATELKRINPQWDDERLYQEARRIVVAQIQHITFNEFLPVVIGAQSVQKYGLNLRLEGGYYADYDLKSEATTINGFAAGAGLFFYSLMPSFIGHYDKDRSKTGERPTSELYYNPSALYIQDKLDGHIRYLLRENTQDFDTIITSEITTKFLRGSSNVGLDMAALILQLGRDHGIPSYNVWRSQCGLRKVTSFNDLQDDVKDATILEQLEKLYKSVDDVDLFVLGLAEKPARGALVGPTFACILGRQFQRIRRGDRFWYENFFFPSLFTVTQLDEIRKTTLARVLCDNTDDLGRVQPLVMMVEDRFENCPVDCNSTVIETVDLSPWSDSEPRLKLPITEDTLRKAITLGMEKVKEIKAKEQLRLNDAGDVQPGSGAVFSHNNLMSPRSEALDLARTADVFLETTKILIKGDQLSDNEKLPKELDMRTLQRLLPQIDVTSFIANATGNTEQCNPKPFPCDHTSPYRTYTGWCNNLRFPQYGNAFGSFRRLLDPVYNDGFSEPRKIGHNGQPLPSARAVANAIHDSPEIVHVKYTHMLMQFAQILDHDLTHAPVNLGPNGKMLNCSRCDAPETVSANCFPIAIPENDPFFPPRHPDGRPRCLSFVRSLIGQLNLGYREQINQLSAFIDASPVYGSFDCQGNELRLFSQGKMNFTEKVDALQHGLPQGFKEPDCRTLPKIPCFIAGDSRVNEQAGLAVMHTMLLREHNRIAERLHRINNFWTDERIYQESRKIMGAQMQHIVFNEFLPKLLGCEVMDKYGLRLKKTNYYTGYDPHCDASISNEFATAAFRFGHTLIRSTFVRMDDFYHNLTSPVRLRSMFMNNSVLYDPNEGGIEAMLIGLLGAPAMEFDRFITEEVRHHLFEKPSVPFSGMDLAALNIQRSRDHGIPGYNYYRELCGLPKAKTFSDLADLMDSEAIAQFQSVYDHVDDIDLFPGIMSEKASPGGLIGRTGACIIAEQFNRLRKCDRFWYENDLPDTKFTPSQLAEIRKASLAKIICANSQFLRMIQPRVFDMPDDLLNTQVPCQDLPEIDLYEWLDRQFCVVDHRVINLGKTKRITPCVSCTCTAEGPECHAVRIDSCKRLLDEFLFSEIMEDTVCIIQCSGAIKQRGGRV